MPSSPDTEPTYWLYTVLLDNKTTLARRQKVVHNLNHNGVGARSFWHTVHDLPPYRSCQAFEVEHSVRLYERGVSLPSSVGMGLGDVERCVTALGRSIEI